jgi:hypothetical protein
MGRGRFHAWRRFKHNPVRTPGAYRTSDKKCKLWPMTDDPGFPAASITAVVPSRQRRLQLLSPNCVCSASSSTALLGEYRVNYRGGKPETADLTVGLASGRAPRA